MERITTNPSPPSPVRRRDVVAFIWHAGAEGERRRREAEAAIQRGDLDDLARLYREAEFQHGIALWMMEQSRGGSVEEVAPRLPPEYAAAMGRELPRPGLFRRLWRALWG